MHIFRWLMKHPVIILVIYFLSIAAILYSMTGGGSSDTKPEIASSEVEQTANVTDPDLSEAPAIEPSTLTTALVTGDTTEGDVKTEESVSDDASATTQQQPNTEAQAAVSEVNTEESQATDSSTAQFSEMQEEELLLMAREAYWNNGLEESAEIYQQLIALSPDVIDYQGELGNVYWRQGFPKKAAELYAEISLPMIDAGESARVANMVGFIGLFFP